MNDEKEYERIEYLAEQLSIANAIANRMKIYLHSNKTRLRELLCDKKLSDSAVTDSLIKLVGESIKLLSGYENYANKIKDELNDLNK